MINHKSYTDRWNKKGNEGLLSVGSMQSSRHDPGNKSTILPWVSRHSAVGNDQWRWGHFSKVTILELIKSSLNQVKQSKFWNKLHIKQIASGKTLTKPTTSSRSENKNIYI